MDDKIYRVFSRTCKNWDQFATAKKITIVENKTLDEARGICFQFNETRNPTQIKRGMKYEFERCKSGY